jgi:hypothetical protein
MPHGFKGSPECTSEACFIINNEDVQLTPAFDFVHRDASGLALSSMHFARLIGQFARMLRQPRKQGDRPITCFAGTYDKPSPLALGLQSVGDRFSCKGSTQ